MVQDYEALTPDQLESLEKQTQRTIVQAVQEYSREARQIFENTAAPSESEVIVLAEDLVQYSLEVAECYPINQRFAGFIDYKRVRWASTPFGLIPQVLLVDAKASTENNRTTLQKSQLPMNAEFHCKGHVVAMEAGVPQHLEIPANGGQVLRAVTTSIFVHYYYERLGNDHAPYRRLKSIKVLSHPHQRLKPIYNPNADLTFFGQGKHSPARHEEPRIRVYFGRMRAMCPWRLQELRFTNAEGYAEPVWIDFGPEGDAGARGPRRPVESRFKFIGR